MASEEVDYQYYTYDGRLASFQKNKKRGSTAKGSKALNWPHKTITAESLARAGFYFQPWADNPDNVVCFLCHKSMDGWEAGDDPLREHLKHSPECGWAVTAAIEAEIETYQLMHPLESTMMEARKATFAGLWPHDGKRAWKCKTKQLVEAGWRYTPTLDSDDNATCAYCGLGLDGWEPGDKPYEEHEKRSPSCLFFTLSRQPKKGRGKTAHASKASRVSTQSTATEAPSMADTTAATADDTFMTTVSTATTQGAKKSRSKKGTATKGSKTKAQKEASVIDSDEAQNLEIPEPQEELAASSPPPPPPPPAAKKPVRGKKRGSEAVNESTLTITSEAPARKKRAPKARGSTAIESSTVEPSSEDHDMAVDAAPAPKKTTGRKKGSTVRKASVRSSASSVGSISSLKSLPPQFPDDDEIERQLEADLERPLTDDEAIATESDSGRAKGKAPHGRRAAQQQKTSKDYAMFDPEPVYHDDEEMEDELDALREQMDAEKQHEPEPESEPEPIQIPKKGRKPGVRKASKQTKPKKAADMEPELPPVELEEVEPEEPVWADPEDKNTEDYENSIGSTGTTVKKTEEQRPATAAQQKKKGSRTKKTKASSPMYEPLEDTDELAEDDVDLIEPPPPPPPPKQGKPKAKTRAAPESPADPPKKRARGRPAKAAQAQAEEEEEEEDVEGQNPKSKQKQKPVETAPAETSRARPPAKASMDSQIAGPDAQLQGEAEDANLRAERDDEQEDYADEIYDDEAEYRDLHSGSQPDYFSTPASRRNSASGVPSTPPSASARQAALSPSQSPQSSDAENQPPSSRAPATVTKHVALVPMEATPVRTTSPSKRNAIAGLQSKTPWKAVDLDAVLGTPAAGSVAAAADKENGADRLLRKGKELTSPEKQMTVEEWIYHNAGEAEKVLRQECEAMVSRFESEGAKAMNVLEELVID
ncbi:Inhibitor of Apoptosis domain [Geosmithia morbida]|uniref:Inhibitor of Apoptosis domain n=1 Tax=Geosmithia morbida TaxID=1094350 RepID=A0A9P5D7D6_9HYPO|nr:Inhibitor of Apoptosis domain [Geosmithia morbida]KAF4126526.1 Inhibitor of Apoptosis domain [Geosmithia morbida]